MAEVQVGICSGLNLYSPLAILNSLGPLQPISNLQLQETAEQKNLPSLVQYSVSGKKIYCFKAEGQYEKMLLLNLNLMQINFTTYCYAP
ncbi:unnamed protein product [Dovyalis caffra]|uniref:Uncharacterized protein n=1 Tax=Dovyalis caffra TaxID=77055 RepID=A0AAV1R982_9ROSI|nr:unnamed protein product [Dovyalis caffra]